VIAGAADRKARDHRGPSDSPAFDRPRRTAAVTAGRVAVCAIAAAPRPFG